MGGEIDSLLFNLPQAGQGEDLKAAGIRQDWAVPGHEFMQAALVVDQAVAGPQMQMGGIGKGDLRADLLQIGGAEGPFDRALCRDIHKNRRLHRAVGAGKFPPARRPLLLAQLKHSFPLSNVFSLPL